MHYIADRYNIAYGSYVHFSFPPVCLIAHKLPHFHLYLTQHNISIYLYYYLYLKYFYDCFHSRPNVCVEREVTLVAQRQPCVQAFTRMVKVWKQGCVGQSWCMGYERR